MSAPATESEPTAVGATDVCDLVWAAAGGLNPDDRQVFELMVRHGLSAPDVAAVLGISPDHAHARLSRARHHAGTRDDHAVPQPAAHHRRPGRNDGGGARSGRHAVGQQFSRPITHRVGYRIAGAATFSVTAEASTRCGGTVSAPTFYLVVTATATGGTFASADLYWSVPRASRPQWMSMTLSGTTAHTRVDRGSPAPRSPGG